MANNPYVNKVVYGNTTLIDISDTTATADKIIEGYTAYGADGRKITGTASGQSLVITDTLDEHGGTIRTITGKVVQLQTKTITPTSSQQVVNPDTGYDGFSQVTVEASGGSTINNQNKTVSPTESQQSITADSGYTGLGTVTVNAISSTYVGSGVTKKAAATITPGTTNKTIASGTYLTGTQTISGDADLTAANIKAGVGIFNVTGTYTSDATAAANDILSGETAYVNGSKVTGTLDLTTVYHGSSAPSSSTGSNGDIYIQS